MEKFQGLQVRFLITSGPWGVMRNHTPLIKQEPVWLFYTSLYLQQPQLTKKLPGGGNMSLGKWRLVALLFNTKDNGDRALSSSVGGMPSALNGFGKELQEGGPPCLHTSPDRHHHTAALLCAQQRGEYAGPDMYPTAWTSWASTTYKSSISFPFLVRSAHIDFKHCPFL